MSGRPKKRAPSGRTRFLDDGEALDRIVAVYDGDAATPCGDVVEEVASLVRLTGRTLQHDDDVGVDGGDR